MPDKKGVSPLIATVLLISFAVALGAVVMNWAGTLQPTACEGVSISVVEDGGVQQVCYDPAIRQVKAMIVGGDIKVSGVTFVVTGKAGPVSTQLIKPLEPGVTKEFATVYDENEFGAISSISLKPVVGEDGAYEVCEDQVVTVKTLARC